MIQHPHPQHDPLLTGMSVAALHIEHAGPSLLAHEPAMPKYKKPDDAQKKEWKTLTGHLEPRLNSLRTWRNSWMQQNYINLAQYIEPRRSIQMTQSTGGIPAPNTMSRGKQINNSIVDPTATYAVRVCASGMMSGLASPSRPWFKVVPSIKGTQIDAEGRAWLDDVEDRIYTILAGSNFYNSFAQECEDLVVFGTAPVIIYEDEQDLIRCYNPCVGEYYLSSGATLRVDGLNRTFVMTVEQIVDYFGADNCPEDIQKLWQAKGSALQTERIVAHSIEPNFGIGEESAGKLPDHFTWREVYWLYGAAGDKPLAIRGFVDQPFTAARWSTQSNDAYGRSVGMDVLPDVIQLQVETMRKAEAIEKMVRPPLLADVQLKNQPSSTLPGHVTYVAGLSAGTGMRPIYSVNPEISALERDLLAIQERIKKGFFNDILLPLINQPGDRRTAWEAQAIVSEKLSVLGPVIENIITESLKPKLRRIFAIMERKNMLPPIPDSMKNIPLQVDFISSLALAQKSASTGGLERIAGIVGNLVAVYPEAKDSINVDIFVAKFSELLDNPQAILRSPEEIAQLRQQAAAAAQKQQQMIDEQHQSTVANTQADTMATGAQAAQTLAGTTVGAGKTALQQLFSG